MGPIGRRKVVVVVDDEADLGPARAGAGGGTRRGLAGGRGRVVKPPRARRGLGRRRVGLGWSTECCAEQQTLFSTGGCAKVGWRRDVPGRPARARIDPGWPFRIDEPFARALGRRMARSVGRRGRDGRSCTPKESWTRQPGPGALGGRPLSAVLEIPGLLRSTGFSASLARSPSSMHPHDMHFKVFSVQVVGVPCNGSVKKSHAVPRRMPGLAPRSPGRASCQLPRTFTASASLPDAPHYAALLLPLARPKLDRLRAARDPRNDRIRRRSEPWPYVIEC